MQYVQFLRNNFSSLYVGLILGLAITVFIKEFAITELWLMIALIIPVVIQPMLKALLFILVKSVKIIFVVGINIWKYAKEIW